MLDVVERARRFLARVEPAIVGHHGDLHTFRVCCRIVRGFDLSDEQALAVLAEWNARCGPPWSERDLRDKICRQTIRPRTDWRLAVGRFKETSWALGRRQPSPSPRRFRSNPTPRWDGDG